MDEPGERVPAVGTSQEKKDGSNSDTCYKERCVAGLVADKRMSRGEPLVGHRVARKFPVEALHAAWTDVGSRRTRVAGAPDENLSRRLARQVVRPSPER